ncbi:hypothetical protein [Streptomyces sp. NPDC006863]|uniref:hypothetical protein n=1 Tax=unclassified Streptomyces TaxID=2593676 RepID=UPI00340631DF
MTSSPRTGAIAVAALAASFTLVACGSDDAPKDSGADAPASAAPGTGDGGSGESGGSTVGAAALEGTWAGLTDGRNVTVSISSGKVALVADRSVCQGDVREMDGAPMLALKCTDGGGADRTMGAIDSVDGSKLVVSWDSGAEDTLTKADPGRLPSGMPSLPGLPDLSEIPAP